MFKELRSILRMSVRVWRALSNNEHGALLIALLIILATGILTSLPPILLGRLVDRMLESGVSNFSTALPFILLIIGATLAREALQVLRKWLVERACTQVGKEKTVEVIAHVLKLDLNYFGSNIRIGSLHGRIHRSIEGFVRMIKLCFLDFFPSTATSICALVAVSFKNPFMAIAMGMVIPCGLLIVLRQVSTQKGIRLDLLRAKEEIDGRAVELLGGIEYVRAANTECIEIGKIERAAEILRSKEIRHHIWMALYDAIKYLNEGGFHILVLCLSIYLANRGTISTGEILTFSLLFASIVSPLREVHRILDEAHESSLRVIDLFDFLDRPIDKSYKILKRQEKKPEITTQGPLIEVRDLCFHYPGSDRKKAALNSINIKIWEGEKLGIVGPSGSGKSTWIKALLRLIHPEKGDIFVNGHPIASIDRKEIASQFGYVSQTPFLFSGTIEENIRYGCEGVSMSQIIDASIRANIHNEILALMDGYQDMVAERGANLSGGQRQRIAIARVLLKNPRVLLLDEATSALDNQNERLVQEALTEAMKGRTVITIAHRLSTLRDADRILVFDEGRIVEEGQYGELLRQGGLFTRLDQAARFGASQTEQASLTVEA